MIDSRVLKKPEAFGSQAHAAPQAAHEASAGAAMLLVGSGKRKENAKTWEPLITNDRGHASQARGD